MDRGVIATALELFAARHYPGVVAVCTDALDDEPECIPLLLFRARANVALRRDLEAQADLRDVIRLDPRSTAAYRLLGELAARNDENAAAAQFFREALRLDPDDREANDWLLIVEAPARSVAGAAKLPATAPAAGRFSADASLVPRSPSPTPSAPSRFPRGTQPHEPHLDDRPTQPFGRVARPNETGPTGVRIVKPQPAVLQTPIPTITGRPAPQPPAKPAPRLATRSPGARSTTRMQIPELPGFGEYLVASGILTRERLRVAEAYQRSMKVHLATAIITLGLATPQRIEWAAIAHQSELAGQLR
ncbi:MAG TPA: hypothetical protein VLM79_20290 [Kofleriaceae bacterium]|nr:hypothetical protein [Kofleriaceae bacterium]